MSINMKAGFAAKVLPEPIGVELCGYGSYLKRVCVGVMDNLFVRAVAFEQDGVKSMILSADLIGLGEKPINDIRRLISDKLGYKNQELMVVCTHTHTGPSTNYLEGCGVENKEYNDKIPYTFLAAAEEAVADMKEVTEVQEACQPIEPVGYNRDTENGPHDAVVRGLLLKRDSADPVAMISYPCHPVVLGPRNTITADYPGSIYRMAEEKGMKPIFLNGCCGDINPRSQLIKWGGGTQETIDEYGGRILKGFLDGLKPVATATIPLKNMEFQATLPLRKTSAEEICEIAEANKADGIGYVWRDYMLAHMPGETETVTLRAAQIGPMTFCSVPFETFTKVGDIVRETYPGKNVAVLGCGDRTLSYLPVTTPEHEKSYASISGSELYVHPMFAIGAAESMGQQIAENLKPWLKD